MLAASGNAAVDGASVPWALALPSTAPPAGGYPLALVLTHGLSGGLGSAELPLMAEAAAGAGVPCLRVEYGDESSGVGAGAVADRARVLQELMLGACQGQLHPALGGVAHWVVGGRSMGARAAADVGAAAASAAAAAAAAAAPVAGASGAGGSGAAAISAADRLAAAGASVVGLVLSCYPCHPKDDPGRIYDQPLGSLQLPLLFVRGTADPYSPQPKWDELRRRVTSPDVTVCTLDGADHMLAVPGGDQAAAWCELRRALEAFLGSRLQELARGS